MDIASRLDHESAIPTPLERSNARLTQRREMLTLQALSYILGDMILGIYAYAGTISASIPVMFFLCGMTLTGVFAGLSEMRFGDRFADHFLTTPQAAANITMQLGFLLAAPQIGLLFLTVVFVIFGFAALRMTSREAILLWAVTGIGVSGILFFCPYPIGMPLNSTPECLAASCCFLLTIGQCAYLGHFGSSLRLRLHQRKIELGIASQRIAEMAQTDELTGLLNRRAIMQALDDEMSRAQRSNTTCSVALIDLDYFKRINDRFGHAAGDEVLRTFAISLFANLRSIDKLGRYGGEEFLLIMPETSRDQAARTLDRLRRLVSGLDWSHISGDMKVTMSVGTCALRRDDSAVDLLARADTALYRAKEEGRDKVVAAW